MLHGAELDLDIFPMLAVVLQTDNKISAPAAGMYLRSESIQSEWSLKNLQQPGIVKQAQRRLQESCRWAVKWKVAADVADLAGGGEGISRQPSVEGRTKGVSCLWTTTRSAESCNSAGGTAGGALKQSKINRSEWS